ncbi:type 1 fimbrial protein [Serratia fonticola]|uniref:fimbrial protein n=1 Tax=Serratia fonticola TaxID=47917 RepID=UPI0015C62688|nr:fimbrial protein [Serratia fonticola]MBC3378343.1 type 1 fimbrial protein [Serratia fonticola]NYA37543.1 type 1 fimbrial protein [Serratia fonticola]
MKDYRYKLLLFFLLLSSGVYKASGDPVQVNITGKVIASPCTLDTVNSTLSVDLGDIQASALSTAGTYGGPEKFFNLILNNCPATTSKVTATFSGTPYDADNNLFANAGSATGVGIKIKTRAEPYTGTTVRPNQSTWAVPINAATRSATFAFATSAYTATGNVTPGTISSVMQVAFTYQ